LKRSRGFSPLHWLEERAGLLTLTARLLQGRVERRGAWLRTTGMTCLILTLVMAVTGAILGLAYTPSPDAAYADMVAIEENPTSRFLRGLHHWGAAALILFSLLTIARMFFGAEYRQRGDLPWIASILFFLLVLKLQLTGHLLPWDTNAVATATVEAGIAGNVWVVGPSLQRLILGGSVLNADTLTRWYSFHVLLLPAALLILVGLPLFALRLRLSSTQEATAESEDPAAESDPYYPTHMAREMVVAAGVFLAVAALAHFTRTPLEQEATAENLRGYTARAEWYVLPLHALITIPPFNNAALEPIATAILPGALTTVLLLLPFVDRSSERRLHKRPVALIAGVLTLTTALVLSVYSLWKMQPPRPAPPASSPSAQRVPPPPGEAADLNLQLVAQGKRLYETQGCGGCHRIAGQGSQTGTDLTGVGTRRPDREWHISHLLDPKTQIPGSPMPSYAHLKREELQALAEYLVSLR
jgi:quinol-cytochrome oxidoreductase complex cytochrome b subunit